MREQTGVGSRSCGWSGADEKKQEGKTCLLESLVSVAVDPLRNTSFQPKNNNDNGDPPTHLEEIFSIKQPRPPPSFHFCQRGEVREMERERGRGREGERERERKRGKKTKNNGRIGIYN